MRFFDFHTHNKTVENGIINLMPYEHSDVSKLYSMGIHPYFISDDYINQIDYIKEKAANKEIKAIGECGFDPKSVAELNLQKEIFKLQVQISEEYELPLIIHCVKFYNELIKLKKELKPKQMWVLHGFNSKIGLFKALIDEGFWFSFGASVLKNAEKIYVFYKNYGMRFFLETDDSQMSIEEIYKQTAQYLNLDKEILVKSIEENLKKIGL
ncbi:MAG: TatD family hydrolase [Bacteroidales bacterium]|jgi:TatD DNase family protein|nr:TatD family hydrolase [Bacteroidales bacterium]HOL96981.1 TatD family hydrolase [Bacteroidales bacterium]HOM36494.1 TatD family hydrolase [Bacteroidales bacterium]HPD24005.1 TatD family hydrolase [Bacteroidales bacterium]HRS98538.1 TatD family hydrolase [Bacteroidales bacterium]